MKWKEVCKPKALDDLGNGNLVAENIALVDKWLWWFPLKGDSLWDKVICSKYGPCQNDWDTNVGGSTIYASPWKFVSQVYHLFSPFVKNKVSNGERVCFLEYVWVVDNFTLTSYSLSLSFVQFTKCHSPLFLRATCLPGIFTSFEFSMTERLMALRC